MAAGQLTNGAARFDEDERAMHFGDGELSKWQSVRSVAAYP
jgi:hypothetical protein